LTPIHPDSMAADKVAWYRCSGGADLMVENPEHALVVIPFELDSRASNFTSCSTVRSHGTGPDARSYAHEVVIECDGSPCACRLTILPSFTPV
jgi:hypothetical protein